MTVQLQLTDSGSQVSVDLGEPVEVRLPEIAGTGYLWDVINDIGAGLAVEARTVPAELPTAVSEPLEPAVGAATQRVFTFVAHTPTDATVMLRRFPPWLGDAEADASFEIRITARPGAGSAE